MNKESESETESERYAFTFYGNPPHIITVQGIAKEGKCVSIIAIDMTEAKAYPALCYRHDNGQRRVQHYTGDCHRGEMRILYCAGIAIEGKRVFSIVGRIAIDMIEEKRGEKREQYEQQTNKLEKQTQLLD